MSFPAPNQSATASSAFPPGVHSDLFHPLGATRGSSANLAALAVPPPGSGTGTLDALSTQPLNTRRPGAPTLPSFELPPPNFHLNSGASKSPPAPGVNPPTSVNYLLTPPATNPPGDSTSPLPPASTTVATSSDLAPSYVPAYWQGQNPYGSSGGVPRQPWPPAINTSYPPPRVGYSPLNLGRSHATTSPVSEGMSQPYDINQLPPYQQPPPVPSPGIPSSGVPQQRVSTHPMLGPQNASPHPLASNDPYGPKSQQTPIYGSSQQMPSPHQPYPPPPPHYPQSGLGIQPSGRGSSGPNPPVPGNSPHLNYPRQPYPSYSIPAMNGPVMTNVHSPNNQMSMMGGMQPAMVPGFHSGHVASIQQMHGGHPPPPGHGIPGAHNDRPFKCEKCLAGFNRNHDLKRHKKIHDAIKPFNCKNCGKAFSRKDALKVRPSSAILPDADCFSDIPSLRDVAKRLLPALLHRSRVHPARRTERIPARV